MRRNTCRAYLPIINLERVKLVGIFGEAARGPAVAGFFLVHAAEVIHGRVLVIKLLQFVSSDLGSYSTPGPEHPVPEEQDTSSYDKTLHFHQETTPRRFARQMTHNPPCRD